MPPGTYRNITGNTALALGLVAAAHRAGLPLVLGSYPITPASDILHALAALKRLRRHHPAGRGRDRRHRRRPRASFGGAIGVTTTSGPGVALKSEAIGLAVLLELPLVIVDVQRGGPSTGLPTKTEQADLLQAMFGRNGESPVPIVAPQSPGRLLRRRHRGRAHRHHLPHPGVPALRRLPRQRLRAVERPDVDDLPDLTSSSPPSPTAPTPRASRSSTPTCATTRPSPARGPSRAPPASSTASAASRRPTSPATSPTTPTTTTR